MTFHKKGNVVFAAIIFIVFLVGCGIVWIMCYHAFSEMKTDLMEDMTMTEATATMDEVTNRYPSWVDGAICIVFIGLWLGGLVSVLVMEEHPIIFGFMMFMLIFVIIAGAILGNGYEEMFQDSELSYLPAYFPLTNWLLTHMLPISIIVTVSILLTMMAKNKA